MFVGIQRAFLLIIFLVLTSCAPAALTEQEASIYYVTAEDKLYDLGDYAQARAAYEQKLAEFEAVGNLKGQADVLNGVGRIYRNQGKYSKAVEAHERALALYSDLGETLGKADALNRLGIVADYIGDVNKSEQYYLASRPLYESITYFRGIGNSYMNVGLIQSARGNYALALENYDLAMDYFMQIEDDFDRITARARLLANSAIAEVELYQFNLAELHLNEATDLFQQIGRKKEEADSHLN